MAGFQISGIQQIGIGVSDVYQAWKWYSQHLGMDVRVFEEEATAELMLPYTGGEPRKRHAALAMNLQGGGGFEIWQYKGRTPLAPEKQPLLGDFGIFAAKIKTPDVKVAHRIFKERGLPVSDLSFDPAGNPHFFLTDPANNVFEIVLAPDWFKMEGKPTGAAYGAIIGVRNIDKAREVYSDILGYDKMIYESKGSFEDLCDLAGGKGKFRRILLAHSQPRKGSFSRVLGSSQIELVQSLDREPSSIFQNRFWGDLGFIHLCYDIRGMQALMELCQSRGYNFTVDSRTAHANTFDMGEAAGHFAYIEDPDGTLIEFVETHKVPILKKIGWYMDLRKRNPEKPLPDWMIKALGLNRVKFK
jgi:catechol 2,3-dioxygenase-like lactoylglutathione lyase family enzyme